MYVFLKVSIFENRDIQTNKRQHLCMIAQLIQLTNREDMYMYIMDYAHHIQSRKSVKKRDMYNIV